MKSNWKNENSLDSHTQWMPLHFAFCLGVYDFLRLAEMVKYWPVSAGREQTYGWPRSVFTKLIVSDYLLKISWQIYLVCYFFLPVCLSIMLSVLFVLSCLGFGFQMDTGLLLLAKVEWKELDLSSCLNYPLKLNKNDEAIISRYRTSGREVPLILKWWERNEVNIMDVPVYCLEKFPGRGSGGVDIESPENAMVELLSY